MSQKQLAALYCPGCSKLSLVHPVNVSQVIPLITAGVPADRRFSHSFVAGLADKYRTQKPGQEKA